MTDIKLDIEVRGVKQIRDAADELLRTGNVSRKLAAEFSGTSAANMRLVQETRRLERVEKQLTKAVNDNIISKNKATRALNEEIRKSKEKILTDKTLIAQAKKRQKAEEFKRKETERMTKAYAPLRSAENQYKATQKEIQQAYARNIITLEEMEQALATVSAEFDQFTKGVATGGNQFAKFNVEAYKSAQTLKRRFNTGLQQAGYQVGDFIVQVQSGQSALIAFGQQGSQLAGIFGPAGAIVGAVIAAGTALGLAYQQYKEAAEGAVKDIQTAFNELPEFFRTLGFAVSDPFDDAFIRIEERYGELVKRIGQQQLTDFRKAAVSMVDPAAEAVAPGLGPRLKVTFTPFLTKEERAERFASLTSEEKAILKIQERLREQVNTATDLNAVLSAVEDAHANIAMVSSEAADIFGEQAEKAGLVALIQERNDKDRAERLKREHGVFMLQNKTRLDVFRTISDAEKKFAEEKAAFDSRTAKNEASAANKLRVVQEGANRAALAFIKRKRQESILALGDEADQLISNANLALELDEKTAAEKRQEALDTANFNFSLVEGLLGTLQKEQEALNKSAEQLGERLGIGYARALEIIRQAQAEATVGLDAFGGPGDFRYSVPTKFDPNKGKGKKTAKDPLVDYIKSLENQRNKEKSLVGVFDEQRDLMESLIEARQKYGDIATESQMKTIEGYLKETHALEQQHKALEEARAQNAELTEMIVTNFGDAFLAIGEGTKTVEEAFRDMAAEIIKELYRVLVVKKMVAAATSFFGFADGGVFSNGNVVPFANGGVVGGPTYFPMSGGRTGLMGEAGPEAIMPLKRGKNGKLGVEASGQGDNITISQTFNFAANGDESVKRIIVKSMPQITEAAKAGVLDARKRGGSFRKVFS